MARGKMGSGSLLLAGLAAFAYYKYSKMSEQEKKNLVGGWKEKGQKLYDEYVPENIKSMVGKKEGSQSNGQHHATV
jgi:hypothetical protein